MSTKADENLKRLRRTPLPMNFVKRNLGCWDHDKWDDFCLHLQTKGYTPIDFDAVGLLLEEKKVSFLTRNNLASYQD